MVVTCYGCFCFLIFGSLPPTLPPILMRLGIGRKGSIESIFCRGMRLSRRMWIWTQYSRRWTNQEWCQGQRWCFEGSRYRRGINHHRYPSQHRDMVTMTWIFTLTIMMILMTLGVANGFHLGGNVGTCGLFRQGNLICLGNGSDRQWQWQWQRQRQRLVQGMVLDKDENVVEESADDFGEMEVGEESGVVLEDLYWRVEKLRLEEENVRRFLKSKPRFLPYEECRKWVQAWGRWKTEKDWYVIINRGWCQPRWNGIPSLT